MTNHHEPDERITKEFDIKGWGYSPEDLTAFWEQHHRALEWYEPRSWIGEDNWLGQGPLKLREPMGWGGKGLGLNMCEILAYACNTERSSPFKVPAWRPFPKRGFEGDGEKEIEECVRDFARCGDVLVRSSAPDEDWLDPRAGIHPTVTRRIESPWKDVPDLRRELREAYAAKRHMIVQEKVYGFGLVVDIGWSEILKQIIVRIAHGKISQTGGGETYTSPTWDHGADVGVYSLDGTVSIPLTYHQKFARQAGQFSDALIHGLRFLKWNAFGLQLEFVISPSGATEWNLVQIRPSPENVRGLKGSLSTEGELLETTGRINQPGQVEGDVVFWDWSPEASAKKKIVLWGDGLSAAKFMRMQPVREAGLAGAVGQISEHTIFSNSAHGTALPYNASLQAEYEEARRMGLLFSISRETHGKLHFLMRNERVRLRMISDGLVGQIYRIA